MADTQPVIRKKKYAPAREIINARLRKLMRGEIKLRSGTGDKITEANKQICIMEAICYITGQDNNGVLYDSPACTSNIITQFMIACNDHFTDAQRAKLKKLVPDIINTAPHYVRLGTACTMGDDPDYIAAEKQRKEIVAKRVIDMKLVKEDEISNYDSLAELAEDWVESLPQEMSANAAIDLARELCAVAHFEQADDPAMTPATA